jgi:hypothetical protein
VFGESDLGGEIEEFWFLLHLGSPNEDSCISLGFDYGRWYRHPQLPGEEYSPSPSARV